MDVLLALDTFIAKVDQAKDSTEVFDLLRVEVERRGFSMFTYILLIGPEEHNPTHSFWVSSYPRNWTEHYLQEDFGPHDLVVRNAAMSTTPFLWSELPRRYLLTKTQRLVFETGKDAGLSSGATVPIRGPGKVLATFSVASEEDNEEFRRLFKNHRHEIHMLATYAHERLMQLKVGDFRYKEHLLSAREIEVLTWAASGKSNEEIGIILTVSSETIKSHLANICRKFNVYRREHAISIALTHGIIQVTPEFTKRPA